MPYTQLTQVQRYQIYALMKAGLNQTQIANMVGVHKSTISPELRRYYVQRDYRPKQAHQRCVLRRLFKARTRIEQATWHLIEHLLRGAPNKSVTGSISRLIFRSVMNGFTSMFWLTNRLVEVSTSICVVKNSVGNAMAPTHVVAAFLTLASCHCRYTPSFR